MYTDGCFRAREVGMIDELLKEKSMNMILANVSRYVVLKSPTVQTMSFLVSLQFYPQV